MGKSIKILTVIILFFSVSDSFSQYYRDNDNDGYGAGIPYFFPEAGYNYATNNDDCNDNNPAINPSKPEKCNGVDDNCNGQVDDGVVIPATAAGSNVARCGSGSVTLSATVGSGGNTIRWYSSASGGIVLHTGTSFTTPSISSTTSYYAESYNSLTFCKASSRKQIQAVINPIPATASGSNVGRCGAGTVTLTASVGSGGNTIRWYSASSGGTLLHTGTSFTTPSISSTTSYYAESYHTGTTCKASSRKQIQAVINPIPATAGGSNVGRCGAGTVTLTASVGSGGNTIRWYSASSGGTLLHTGTSFTTPSISSTTSYYAESYHTGTTCKASSRKQIQAVINPIPATAGGSNVGRCGSGAVTLTASVGSGGNTIRWYSASSGGTLLHTGTSFTTPSISSTTSYYAESYHTGTTCKASSRKQIQAVINPIPATAGGDNVGRCGTGTVTLTALVGSGGNTIRWYSASSGGTLLHTGTSFTTPSLSSTTSYYAESYHTGTTCKASSRKLIKAIINTPPTWYADTDGDGYGNPSSSNSSCSQPTGYVNNSSDYDDTTTMITNIAPQTFYLDKDGDGFGESTASISASFQPLGYTDNTLDQCPDVPGSNIGCDYQSPVPSDENYIFSRTYQTAMSSPNNIKSNRDVLENIKYFDGLGRPMQQIAIKGSMTQSNSLSPNYAPGWTMDWQQGLSSTNFFNRNGQASENEIISGPDPFGNEALIWACGNDPAYDGDGGWNTDYINVDKTKTYRYTVWVRRDYSQDGRTYHGTRNVDNLGGGADTNPYFFNGDLPQLGEWYLLVGIVHPYNYSGNGLGISGVYDMQGNKVDDGEEFKWGSSTTTSSFRSYLYYATDVNVRQYFYQPILEIIDGTEVSLQDMFQGQGSKDLVTHVAHDDFGRQVQQWLPYPEQTGSLGSYRGDVSTSTQLYYQNEFSEDFIGLTTPQVNSFSEIDFEPSPLSRVMEQAAPGKDWRLGLGQGIRFEYETNWTNEVRLYNVNISVSGTTYNPILSINGFYASGELIKNVTKDENHDGTSSKLHTTEEFMDKSGRVVLKRTFAKINNVVTEHDTYYVYDTYGNLTFVLPPKMNGTDATLSELQNMMDDLGYQYKYDHRNRLVEKKIPGKGWEEIVYDKLDRPIMTRDANLQNNDNWLFTKYDAFGRIIYTGLDSGNNSDRSMLQAAADLQSGQFETRTSYVNNYVGTNVYYSKVSYPDSFDAVYTINYYDSYIDTDGLTVPASVLGQSTSPNVKGLATVNKVRVLDTNDWITTITGYDSKKRPIYSATKNNYLNTTDIVETKLDFAGKVVETKTTHQRVGFSDIVTVDTFSYDELGRLLTQKQTIGAQPEETLVNNGYDALGRLKTKQVGGGLQTVDFNYNVRGWLKSINNPTSLGNDLFAFGISYNNSQNGSTPLYNGNISHTEWRTANDGKKRYYNYTYDAKNRIKVAGYNSELSDEPGWFNVSNINYDKNGNIQLINRAKKGSPTAGAAMDYLTYTYDLGNRLLAVEEQHDGAGSFEDGTNSGNDYTYDVNGNMTSDANKGITDIDYNHLNLPTNIVTSSGNISYVYDATGTKLEKMVSVGNIVTQYARNFVYSGQSGNETLQFMSQPEGYVTQDGMNGYDYVYQYKDHLGNVRLSYTDDPSNPGTPTIIEENNYYPFGLKHEGYNDSGISSLGNDVAQKWKFGGKEYDESFDINTYDFGARNYDPALGRWMNIDPLAEQMRRHSPYNYAFDNPVYFIDPDGMMPLPSIETLQQISDTLEDVAFLQEVNTDNIEVERLDEVVVTNEDNSSDTQTAPAEDCCKDKLVNLHTDDLAKATVTAAGLVAVADGPAPVADVPAGGMLVTGLAGVALMKATENFVNENHTLLKGLFDAATDSSKNERHGDREAENKVERQIAELEAQLQTATGNAKKKLKQKIQNIRKNAKKNKKGETHSRNAKGN